MQVSTSDRKVEFVLLIAFMFAVVAFSIDPMLPALPLIAADLGLSSPEIASYVMLIFLVGLGLGTLIAGPLSDAYGRRPVVFVSLGIYALGALLSSVAQSFELMMAARLLQGIGAAGPRVVSAAILRDTFKGPEMARILSLSFMVFLAVPALAPACGAFLTEVAGWRSIFASFIVFGGALALWFYLRQPETLPVEKRRPLKLRFLWESLLEIYSNTVVRLAVLTQTLVMGTLFALLAMVQPIFEVTYDRAETFPYWFGAIALFSGVSSMLNARLVVRFGMRRIISFALFAQLALTVFAFAMIYVGTPLDFAVYIVWQTGLFMMAGLSQANLTSFAAEPMGHIAGFTSSVVAAVSTIGGTAIGFASALVFDGTVLPLLAIVIALLGLSILLMTNIKQVEVRLAAE